MKAFFAFLLIPLSMVVYMALSQRGIYQLYPIGNLAVMVYGLALLGVMVWKAATWWRWTLVGLGGLLIGLFSWWVLVYSSYPDESGGTGEGEVVAGAVGEARLVDATGRELALADVLGRRKATLLVFFRGWW